jgi:hypothetical protein
VDLILQVNGNPDHILELKVLGKAQLRSRYAIRTPARWWDFFERLQKPAGEGSCWAFNEQIATTIKNSKPYTVISLHSNRNYLPDRW